MNQYGIPTSRKELKTLAKRWMASAQPAFWKVTLVYLLATSVLEDVVKAFLPGDELITQASEYMADGNVTMTEHTLAQLFQDGTGALLIFVSVLLALYNLVVNYGYISYSLGVIRNEQPGYGELFSRFYLAGKIILAQLLTSCLVFLWSLLFVIPGIVAAYRYSLVPYLLIDDPDRPVLDALRRSRELMQGRKWELFTLELSFLLWIMGMSFLSTLAGLLSPILSEIVVLACNVFLTPYMQFTTSLWYETVRILETPSDSPEEN